MRYLKLLVAVLTVLSVVGVVGCGDEGVDDSTPLAACCVPIGGVPVVTEGVPVMTEGVSVPPVPDLEGLPLLRVPDPDTTDAWLPLDALIALAHQRSPKAVKGTQKVLTTAIAVAETGRHTGRHYVRVNPLRDETPVTFVASGKVVRIFIYCAPDALTKGTEYHYVHVLVEGFFTNGAVYDLWLTYIP